jgi:hypothetical protein
MDLGNGQRIRARIERTAWITPAAHPEGLLCIRLGVPDHSDRADQSDKQYLSAIQQALGCPPHVTGTHYESKDWILDAECQNDNIVHNGDLTTTFRLQALAAQLRREGITHLFSYVQHEKAVSSILHPAAEDNFVDHGLQWYISSFALTAPIPDETLTSTW